MLDCFCMEPGYKGPLILVLYNASRKEDSFRLGTKLVVGVFYKLEPEEAEMVQKNPDLVYDFADNPPTSMEVFQNELKMSWQELEAQKLEELFAKEKSERKKILVRTSILSFLLGVFITVIIMLLLRHI